MVTAPPETAVAPRVGRGMSDSHFHGQAALPPTNRGWLILSPAGALRSSTMACGTLRTVNLETGATFVHDGCADRASTGRVSADEARRAMRALLAGELGTGGAEAGTPLYIWRWVDLADTSLIGDFRKISRPGAVAAAVRRLLDDFDTLRTDACAPPLPPPAQLLVATLPRMVNAVSADESQGLTVAYRRAREQWTRLSACQP